MMIFAAGFAFAALLILIPWPFYKRHPVPLTATPVTEKKASPTKPPATFWTLLKKILI